MIKKIILCIATLNFLGGLLQAQVPGTLSYQGILLQSDGSAIVDGTHSVVFNFYTTSTGGAATLTRTISVTTSKGLYTCIIGDGTAGNAALPATVGTQQLYIGISVDGGAELLPRAQLTTSPYAFQAQSAYAMNGSGLTDNTVTSAKITDGTIATADLADNSITSAKISNGVIVDADINAAAAIVDSKLATISTAGKVSGSAITSGTIGGNTVVNTTGTITGASFNYSTPKTDYLSVNHVAFSKFFSAGGAELATNRVVTSGSTTALNINNTAGSLAFAPIYLPNGAIVTNVSASAYIFDSYGSYYGLLNVNLIRQSVTATYSHTVMASISFNGTSASSTSTINNNVIDNANYSYKLEIGGNYAYFYGIRITYTVANTD